MYFTIILQNKQDIYLGCTLLQIKTELKIHPFAKTVSLIINYHHSSSNTPAAARTKQMVAYQSFEASGGPP